MWAERQYVRGEQLQFAFFTSMAFDLTVTSLFLPLTTGGTLVVYREPEGPADTSLVDVIQENTAEFIKLTPSHLSILKELDSTGSRLRRMVVGGEDFQTHLARRIQEQFGDTLEVYNEYGPTEAVVGCMIHRFAPHHDTAISVPIGGPADHVELYVLNEALLPVPEGTVGELFIAREGLARGYCNREDLTAERFVSSPFKAGQRLYRSGDAVRFVRPGVLDYLGRLDRQVKIAGHRIELGEVESVLSGIDGIDQCVVALQHKRVRERKQQPELQCVRCGLSSTYPGIGFDSDRVCSICRSYEEIREAAQAYFKPMEELEAIFKKAQARNIGAPSSSSSYDCMALLSGGKDSTYALCRLVDMGLKVYAFTLDNGYISDEAKANIGRVVKTLSVDHEFATTPAMNAIFRDSLVRFSNVCNGCFKTVYTLSMQRAAKLGIPIIVTGLSRGQFFETRLTEELFRGDRFSPEDVDAAVLAARRSYHAQEDEVSRSLDVSLFQNPRIFEEIRFVDFYRYCDINLEDMLSYLENRVPWIRPSDTGRSTNCRINDVGIYIHQKERGHHNYALPYSWDVRMGHKNRKEALEELNDELDLASIQSMLAEIGYNEDRLSRHQMRDEKLVAYCVSAKPQDESKLRAALAARLPEASIPTVFVEVDEIPLTTNGKVDYAALPDSENLDSRSAEDASGGEPPQGPVEEQIAEIWGEFLGVDSPGTVDSFFRLGGTSLGAMNVMLAICRTFEVNLPLQTIFQTPTIRELATLVEAAILEEVAGLSDEEAELLAREAQQG
jgi:acyl-CoA synthetase (AMP-forming)/AMP-acid ligase II/acyl carrier protein